MFLDRADAGQQLARALPPLDPADTIVLALPRGGVPIAVQICGERGLPLDLILVRKIGAPGQPELAVGAITDGDTPHVIVNEEIARAFRLSNDQVESMGLKLLPEIERRRANYIGGRKRLKAMGKTVVVVDDGVATGATLIAALTALRAEKPRRVIVALPVGPADIAARIDRLADTVLCLSDLGSFGSVGGAYRSFPQVDDRTVQAALARFTPV